MAHEVVTLFSLCAVLTGIESKLTSVHECCEAGRALALRKQDCTALPRLSSHICSIAKEHCCRALARKRACDTGVKAARGRGACERALFTGASWETQISQSCCDCCTLGLRTDSMGFSCDFQDLQLDRQCSNAAKVCCEKPRDVAPSAKELKVSRPPDEPNTCRELNCSQLCAGDGRCVCSDGFRLQSDGVTCEDIDECSAHASPCQPGRTCVNTVGSYSCRTNAITCPRGFHLSVNGTRCEDVNECMVGSKCAKHACVNLEGLYRCECRSGYMFNSVTKLCEDINECTHYPGRLCAHKCENTEGSYRCSCATGFKLANGGSVCEDIDECEDKPCSQECTNVYGSYQCYCRRGYRLNDVDGITCEDIDECTLPNVCSYQCVNTPGDFNCTCPSSGYTLSLDGRTCQDIDECAAGTHSCSAKETCFNVQGGFRCLSFDCPPNFRRAGKGSAGNASAVVRCVKECQEHDGDCARDPVHIITSTALSLPTFQRLKEPEEIVLLRTSAEAKRDLLPDEPDVSFDILADDDLLSFDVIKRAQNGMVVGVIRQIKPVLGPKELILEASMKYVQSGVVSQQNVVLIHVFISEFWF